MQRDIRSFRTIIALLTGVILVIILALENRQGPHRYENPRRFPMAQAFNAHANHLGRLADTYELFFHMLIT